MFIEKFKVESPNVRYGEEEIESVYEYATTELVHESRGGGPYQWIVKPMTVRYHFKTQTRVPKLGVMLVGWGGNNGSTLTAGVIANRGDFMGDQGQGATSQLFRILDPGLHH